MKRSMKAMSDAEFRQALNDQRERYRKYHQEDLRVAEGKLRQAEGVACGSGPLADQAVRYSIQRHREEIEYLRRKLG